MIGQGIDALAFFIGAVMTSRILFYYESTVGWYN